MMIKFKVMALCWKGDVGGRCRVSVAGAVRIGSAHSILLLLPHTPPNGRESMGIKWKRKDTWFLSMTDSVWIALPDLNLPRESSLLAVLCVPAAFQYLDNCIPSLVARSQPLAQNAGTSEGNCLNLPSRCMPFICKCNLHMSSSPWLWYTSPFQDRILYTYLAGEVPWSWRWFSQGEAYPDVLTPAISPNVGNSTA